MTKEEYIQEQRQKVFQKIYNVNSSLQILEYNGTNKNITCYCERCGQEFTQHYTNLENNNFQCPKCRKIKTIQRGELIYKQYPDLIEWFVDKKIPYIYGSKSKEKTKIKCPDCGFEEYITIVDFIKRKSHCKNCAQDTISFPNKILREFLKQVESQVDETKTEYRKDWCKPYFYDGYFKIDEKEYLIEMHGEQHYKEIGLFNNYNQKENDKKKIKLAKENNKELIIIDCRKSDFNFIKDNIIKSKLSKILDLSKINWEIIAQNSSKNYVKIVCDLYNNGESVIQISKELFLERHTILKMLKLGAECNWTNYKPIPVSESSKKKVLLTNEELNFQQVFNSRKETVLYLRSIGHNVMPELITNYTRGWYVNPRDGKVHYYKETPTYHGYKFEYI